MKGQSIELLRPQEARVQETYRLQLVAEDGSTKTTFVRAASAHEANSMFVIGIKNWIDSKALHGVSIRSRSCTKVVQSEDTPFDRAMRRYMAARPLPGQKRTKR